MEYRNLGRCGTVVSAVSLGGWINFEAKIPQEEAQQIIQTAYRSGVNFYDLADVYGYGEAERWMGGLLKDFPRHTLVISTKVFWPMSDGPNDQGLHRKHILESIDRSLRNLGTDYLDIYFCHRADPNTPVLETARAMTDLIRRGKVLYWGTSNWEPDLLQQTYDLCETYDLYPPQVEQPQYSMLVRDRLEQQILPLAERLGFGLTVYSPLAMGLLTGKYDEGVPEGSRFETEPWSKDRHLTEENARKVKALKPIADQLGCTRAQLALAWVLRQPGVSSAITGATRLRQLQDNLGALDVKLTDDVLAEIERVLNS